MATTQPTQQGFTHGGEGGQSAYMSNYITKIQEGVHTGEGYTEIYIRTQKPYDQLTSTVLPVRIIQRVNYSGTRTNILTIKADYSYSSRYMCRIRSTIASPIKVQSVQMSSKVLNWPKFSFLLRMRIESSFEPGKA